MKKYVARFWRSNPQLPDGGYETTRTIEAKTIASARKKANEIASRCIYGGMSLISVVRNTNSAVRHVGEVRNKLVVLISRLLRLFVVRIDPLRIEYL